MTEEDWNESQGQGGGKNGRNGRKHGRNGGRR
jgi:hypothetical protein